MTKGEYLAEKKFHIMNPKFDLNEEADEKFKKNIDNLIELFTDFKKEDKK